MILTAMFAAICRVGSRDGVCWRRLSKKTVNYVSYIAYRVSDSCGWPVVRAFTDKIVNSAANYSNSISVIVHLKTLTSLAVSSAGFSLLPIDLHAYVGLHART